MVESAGPRPALGAMSLNHPTGFVHQPTTADSFLGGRLQVLQPAKGFRAGLESVLLGAAVRRGEGRLLDLGSGVGVAALVALRWNPELSALLVEAEAGAAALAAKNIEVNGLEARARVAELDLAAAAAVRESAGLLPNSFAAAVANPPFFPAGTRAAVPNRAAARHMPAADLDRWAKIFASCLLAGGEGIFIHLTAALPPLLTALESRFGAITVLPLAPHDGEPASRILVRGSKGSRAPLTLLPPLVLHGKDGGFTPRVEAVLRGEARLHW